MKEYLDICSLVIRIIRGKLKDAAFMKNYRAQNCFVRKRKLSMYQLVIYLLFTTKASMFQNTSNIRKDLKKLHFPKKITKQAVSKARTGILPELFRELFRISTETFFKHRRYYHKKWRDFVVFAVDGSKIELPETKKNLRQYGGISVSNGTKTRVMGLLSTLYDVAEDFVVDGKLYRYGYSERLAAKDHLNYLKSLNIRDKCLLIFDRGYFASWLCDEIESQGCYYLFRCKIGCHAGRDKRSDFNRKVKVGNSGKTITIRYVRVVLSNGQTELLATNITDPYATADDFRKLYFMRWGIECKYREAKEQMQLEEFSGCTSCAVEQDLYINLLYMNLVSLVKHAADEKIRCEPGRSRKYEYQANRSFIIGQMKRLIPRILLKGHIHRELLVVLEEAIERRSQIQPNRKNERHKRPAQRKHFVNRKTTT